MSISLSRITINKNRPSYYKFHYYLCLTINRYQYKFYKKKEKFLYLVSNKKVDGSHDLPSSKSARLNSLVFTKLSGVKIQCGDLLCTTYTRFQIAFYHCT